jgi:dTDP-4-amino-4,6-dideoxygalactose transaminase
VEEQPPITVYLSPPDVGEEERALLLDAFDSGWIAPVGPHLDAFETEVAERVGAAHAVALSSGTAALHLALLGVGVQPGDKVLCSTLTFVATANAIVYAGAEPVFVDAEEASWNLDVDLLEEELRDAARRGERYAAVVAVDLYGRCCDYDRLESLCRDFEVPLIEDAAEALGSTHRGRHAGTFGAAGIFSFNGNKIVTTSGGGMLVTQDAELAARARHLATQAREPALHYEHEETGFNYRLSNLLAAIGRGQVGRLSNKVEHRRARRRAYQDMLGELPGLTFHGDGPYDRSNAWLTCLTLDPATAPRSRDDVVRQLRSVGIESRPVWKPMHLQPVYRSARCLGGHVSERLFDAGLCLPSGAGSRAADGDDDVVTSVARYGFGMSVP